jgi:hypothetical protein
LRCIASHYACPRHRYNATSPSLGPLLPPLLTPCCLTELLDDAVVRDYLADHAQECYGGSMPKSMKAVELGGGRLQSPPPLGP